MSLLRSFIGALALVTLSCVAANACQCLVQAPACADYWRADAVFVGSVTDIFPAFDDFESSVRTKTRKVGLTVDNAYRGSIGTHIDLENWINSCEFRFEKGKKYLIYAYRNDDHKTLGTHGCSRTTELSNSMEELGYINSLTSGNASQHIAGLIQNPLSEKPVRGMRIVATIDRQRLHSISGRDGTFKISLPRPGRYTVKIYLPRDYSIGGPALYVDKIKNVTSTAKQTIVEYDLYLSNGQCEFLVIPATKFSGP